MRKARADEGSVATRARELRTRMGLSLRTLAGRSGLSINTLSLIETGKTSPSVATLQQLARGLGVAINAFFESTPSRKPTVLTRSSARPEMTVEGVRLANLAKDLADENVNCFVVRLMPGTSSGARVIVHTGHEFVYILSGQILYTIDENEYLLDPGDSLVFEAHLPHRWQNRFAGESEMLLFLCSRDAHEEPGKRHFPTE